MNRIDPAEQGEDDFHEIATRVSNLHGKTLGLTASRSPKKGDQNITVVSNISEPNSAGSLTKQAS